MLVNSKQRSNVVDAGELGVLQYEKPMFTRKNATGTIVWLQ